MARRKKEGDIKARSYKKGIDYIIFDIVMAVYL